MLKTEENDVVFDVVNGGSPEKRFRRNARIYKGEPLQSNEEVAKMTTRQTTTRIEGYWKTTKVYDLLENKMTCFMQRASFFERLRGKFGAFVQKCGAVIGSFGYRLAS